MLLLLLDKQAKRGHEPRIRSQRRMRRRPPHESAAARIFAKLKLLNRSRDGAAFSERQFVRILPRKGACAVAIFEEMLMPAGVGRIDRGGDQGCHGSILKYFTMQSQEKTAISTSVLGRTRRPVT